MEGIHETAGGVWPTFRFSAEGEPPDFEIRLLILGAPISAKNSKQPRIVKPAADGKQPPDRCPCCGGAVWLLLPLSTPAKRWRREAVRQLANQWPYKGPLPRGYELNAAIVTYLATRRLADASNLYQGPEDALEEAGILEDDVQIVSHDGSDRRYDKHDPRVEITLTPYHPRPDAPGQRRLL